MLNNKRISIDCTINLGNYENVRVGVEGDAEDQKDVVQLIDFLEASLKHFGHGKVETREFIEAYCKQVLARKKTISEFHSGGDTGEKKPASSGSPVPVVITAQPSVLSEKKDPPATAGPEKKSKSPENPPAFCSVCETPLSVMQRRISMTVFNRPLCKVHHDEATRAAAHKGVS